MPVTKFKDCILLVNQCNEFRLGALAEANACAHTQIFFHIINLVDLIEIKSKLAGLTKTLEFRWSVPRSFVVGLNK